MYSNPKAIKKTLIYLLLSLLFLTVTQAQRPKIGLTLSGGGAKGLAHVGILQALDSAGLNIDYVTGTSMGSIIGAMYAIGYSGNQIDSIVTKLNWEELLSGKPKFTDIGLDEKNEYGKYAVEIPVEGLKPKLGTGLIESEEIWLQFSEIFFHSYDQNDFNKYAIPFKCVATDLGSGNAVVLESGGLVKALRSSMALPSVFSAVEYDNKYLIDGGIVRNFPVSDVKLMGADYVIGVNLFGGLSKAEDLNSALDVMYQITNYRDADNLLIQKKKCNLLIEPELGEFSAGSFADGDKILNKGYQLRDQYYPIFKHLADSLNAIYSIKKMPPRHLNANKKVIIDDYEITGLEHIKENTILEKGNIKPGESMGADDLNTAFRQIYSTLYFKYIYYELQPTTPGHAKLIIIAKEQTQAQFKIALSYHTFTTPGVILNYTFRNLLFDKSRTMAKASISEDFKALFEHSQFFGDGLNNSINLMARHIQQKVNLYNRDEISNEYNTANNEILLGYHYYLSTNSAISFNNSYRYSVFSPNIASNFRYDGYNRDLFTQIAYETNSTNRPFLPTKGLSAKVAFGMEYLRKFQATYSGTQQISDSILTYKPQDPLFRADFVLDYYKPFSSTTTIITNVQCGRLFADKNFYLDNYLIGGNQKLYRNQYTFAGYQEGQIIATSFVSGLIGVQQKVIGELYVLGKANIGLYNFLTSSGFTNDIKSQLISGFNASVAYNLSVLPIEFGVNYTPDINMLSSSVRIGFIF